VRVTFETLRVGDVSDPGRYGDWRVGPVFGGFYVEGTTEETLSFDGADYPGGWFFTDDDVVPVGGMFRYMRAAGLQAPESSSVIVELGPYDELTIGGVVYDEDWDRYEELGRASGTIDAVDLVPGRVSIPGTVIDLDVLIDVVVGPGAGEQPDLTISDVTAHEESGQLRIHVFNNAADLVNQDVTVRLETLVSHAEIATLTWQGVSIPSGGERLLQSAEVVHEPYGLRAIVDPDDSIDEMNEDNNTFSTPVQMRVEFRKLSAGLHVCEHWLHHHAEVYYDMWVGRGTSESEVDWFRHVRFPASGEAMIDRYAQAYDDEPAPVWNLEDDDAFALDLEVPDGERLWIRIEGHEADVGDDDAMGTILRSYGAADNWGDGTSTGWIMSTGYGTTDADCDEDRGIGNVDYFAGFSASWGIARLH
jgi:hypothetical protein